MQSAPAKFSLRRLVANLSTLYGLRFNSLPFTGNIGHYNGSLSLTGMVRQGSLLVLGFIFVIVTSVAARAERSKEKPPSFGGYYPAFKDVCVAIADDGMSVDFYQLLSSLIDTPTSECLACKNFFRGFASSCRPKISTVSVKQKVNADEAHGEHVDEEVTPSPTPIVLRKPTLPALEVIDAVSALGNSLSEDSSLENFLPQIVSVFNKRLLGKGEKGNKYFYTLAVYLTQSLAEEHVAQSH